METTLGQRLDILLKNKKMSQKQLADMLGVDPSAITQFKKDNSKPALSTSQEICKIFNVNLEWFLTGEGEEGKKSNYTIHIDENTHNNIAEPNIKNVAVPYSEDFIELPYISIPAQASFLDMFQDETNFGAFNTYRVYKLDPALEKKGAIIIEVSGDSMEPQLKDRSKVLAVPVAQGDWIYQSGSVYALAYANQFVIKRISNNNQFNKTLTLTSDNPTGGRFVIPVNDIRGMWKIIKIIDSNVE